MNNILFYCPRYPHFGGIEIVTTHITKWLSVNGYKVWIFSFEHSSDRKLAATVPADVNVVFSPVEQIAAQENVAALKHLISTENIDIVVMQDSYAASLAETLFAALEDFPKVKLAVVEHNAPNHIELLYKYRSRKNIKEKIKKFVLLGKRKRQNRSRHLMLYNRADRYVLLSKQFVHVWERVTGLNDHPKLTYINNPVTCDEPSDVCLPTKCKESLFVGRLAEQKGIHLLLPIWKRIEQQCPDWTLTIVGDGELRGWMETYIRENGLKHVAMEGMQSNTAQYYRRASLLFATSLFEGWLLTLSESMINFTPPLLYNTYAAASDIVTSGENGYLFTPMDEDTFVSTAVRLMRNAEERNALACCAHESARRFSIERIGQLWVKLIKSLQEE